MIAARAIRLPRLGSSGSVNRYPERSASHLEGTKGEHLLMRVIAGLYRGRRLLAPVGLRTRPILDRVKVALFDWLGSMLAEPGRLPAVAVLDIFSGGGSLGIEALSRGAASCVFVETDPQALRCLRENIETLGIGPSTSVVAVPVGSLRQECLAARTKDGFGLVFLDPPYPMSMDLSADSPMTRTLDHLAAVVPAASEALLVWRHPIEAAIPEELPGGWVSLGRRTWGRMAVTMFRNRRRETT